MKPLVKTYLTTNFKLKVIGFLLLVSVIYSCKNKEDESETHPFCASDYCSVSGKNELINLYQNNKLIKDTLYFNVNCIVATKNSPAFFKIENTIKKLNHTFSSSHLQFRLLPKISHYPQNINLDEIEREKSSRRLVTLEFEKGNALNIFIVPHGEYLNGFTYVIQENFLNYFNLVECNTIFISEKAWFNESTLVHEMGHFFGLQHTFGGSPKENTTLEKPDGSNCNSEGDFICDTPADPNGKINKKCEYIGLSDAGKHNFKPLVNNYMSYYRNSCKNEFTLGQYASINAFANKYRTYLRENSILILE